MNHLWIAFINYLPWIVPWIAFLLAISWMIRQGTKAKREYLLRKAEQKGQFRGQFRYWVTESSISTDQYGEVRQGHGPGVPFAPGIRTPGNVLGAPSEIPTPEQEKASRWKQ